MYFKFGIFLIVLSCVVACANVHMENAKLLKHEEWHHVDLPKKFHSPKTAESSSNEIIFSK